MKNALYSLLFLGFTFNAYSQTDSLITATCIAKIDSTYNALLKKNKVVGTSIALVKDGKIIYATGYGFQDREKNIAADENTIYRIGSCTKSFTALSLLQLQEQKKLELTEPIQKYIPELTIQSRFDAENQIQISTILSHTSGLPSDILNGFFCDNPPTMDWLIAQLNNCTMAAPANYQQSYSNVGYGILGELIARTSGQEYGDYLQKNIFTPLNMSSTFLDDKNNTSPNMSVAYIDGKPTEEVQITDQAAGLIASSTTDMAKYLNLFLANGVGPNGPFISEASLNEMQANYTASITLPTSDEWGYGLYADYLSFTTKDADTVSYKMIGHGGDTWAFHADFQFIPELNLGAVVLTNTDKGPSMSSAKRLLGIYLKEMEGKKQVFVKKEQKTKESRDQACSREEVLGDYYFSGIEMQVKNPSRIKMKQGAHKIIFKESGDSLHYKGKIRLFGVVPIKIKHQEFKFVKMDNQVYLKVIMTRTGNEEYASVKNNSIPLSEIWKTKLGNYAPATEVYSCDECPYMNFKGLKAKLEEKNGKLIFTTQTDDKKLDDDLVFVIVDDEIAVTPGIGRNTGETLRLLQNGNLFYSGFEFKLVK
jgi:CubicO group peptidase (beta-lactamase class C family)